MIAQKDLFPPEFVKFMDENVFKESAEALAPAIKDTLTPARKVSAP